MVLVVVVVTWDTEVSKIDLDIEVESNLGWRNLRLRLKKGQKEGDKNAKTQLTMIVVKI